MSEARTVSVLGEQVRASVWQGRCREKISCAFLLTPRAEGNRETPVSRPRGVLLQDGLRRSTLGFWAPLDVEVLEPLVFSFFLVLKNWPPSSEGSESESSLAAQSCVESGG